MLPPRLRNSSTVLPCLVVIAIMLGLVAYSPTLYRLFCAATGYGGTTQRVDSDSSGVSSRIITVRFDTNVASGMPWRFEPVQSEVKVHLGEQQLVFFRAENLSDMAVVGHATFNVAPATSGIYFNKIQCFCFNEERLDAHQKVDMPVLFFVSPEMMTDSETRDIDTITLSYTFFRSANPENAKDLSRFQTVSGEPSPLRGRQAFAERCGSCHSLDTNKTGPMLRNVVGRVSGSVTGYNYSPALSRAGLRWSVDNLDRWLTDPAKVIPGTRMPVRVANGMARKDLIAYLKEEANRPARRAYSQAGTSSAGQPAQN